MFSALSVLRLYFRLKAGLFRRSVYAPEEPRLFIVVRSVLGVPLLAGVFCFAFLPDRLSWLYLNLPDGLRLAGIVLGAAALVLLARVHRVLGAAFSTGPGPRPGLSLVQAGPYARVRHPMYAAYFLLFAAAFLVSGSWVIGVTGLAIIGMLMTVRLFQEEALLARCFGREYLAYRERTGRFVPRLRGRGTPAGRLTCRESGPREPGPRAPVPPGAPPPARRRSRSPRTGSARRR